MPSASVPAHEGLEDREEDAGVLRHAAFLPDFVRLDARQRVLGKGREGVVGLIGQDVAVGEEQDARPPRRLARRFQRLWNSVQAIWKAIAVLPVPVASVSRMRCLPAAIASSAFSMALCW